MAKGLLIEALSAPPEDDEAFEEAPVDEEDAPPKQDGDAIIAGIQAQLDKLRGMLVR